MPDAPRVGLIGCGRWGRNILRDLRLLGCQVTVVARSDSSTANARSGGAAELCRSARDLPADLDAYVIATPTVTHYEVMGQIGDRGRPIYCEKPLAASASHARDIVDRWGDHVFVMHKWRYHPAIEAMRLWIESGRLGDIVQVRSRRVQWGNPHDDVDASWILMPHDVSIVLHLLGEVPTVTSADAVWAGDRVKALSARLGSGPLCHLEISSVSPVTQRSVEVIGTEGSLELSDADYRHLLHCSTASTWFGSEPDRIPVGDAMPLLAELDAFVTYVRGEGPPPMSSAGQGLAVVNTIETMRNLSR